MLEEILEEERKNSAPEQPRETLSAPGKPGLGLQVAQLYYDYGEKERRAGNRQDLIDMIHFGDVLHEQGSVGHSLLMTEANPMTEPLEAVRLLIEHAHTPGHTYPHYAEQFDYLAQIGEIYCDDREHFLIGGIFITSPLRLCERAADFMTGMLARGLDCSVGTMPVVGATVPVTMAGSIAVSAAEIIGCWAATKALRPEAPLGAGIAAGSIDMRTGNATFCSPEAMLLNFGTVEFFRKACGKRIGIAGASDYCDARLPGLYAAYEKATKVMTVAFITGQQSGVGGGMLESGKTLSPEQLLLEREVTDHLRRLAQPVEVSDETLAMPAILEVGVGQEKSYVQMEHTLHHFRKELWQPALWGRTAWEGYERERAKEGEMLDKAHAQFKEMLASYEPPEVDPTMLAEIDRVIEKAKQEIG